MKNPKTPAEKAIMANRKNGRPLLKELMARAAEISSRETRADNYVWWETDGGKKLVLLEQAFKLDATDVEACAYADISETQLYYYQRNINPDFLVLKNKWKQTPTIIARHAVVGGLKDDPILSFRYLERKLPDEFALKNSDSDYRRQEINFYVSDQSLAERVARVFTQHEPARIVEQTGNNDARTKK